MSINYKKLFIVIIYLRFFFHRINKDQNKTYKYYKSEIGVSIN